ncbi:SLATT domain-containing protein [Chryseobacterium taichungense]|nr:SLATT domain-containing protein [Chryseobacterium taichungense]
MMQDTIALIKRIKVDALYGKKKHFNAADRKEKYHYWIGIPLLVLNIISGSILFYVLTDGVEGWIKYVPLFITLLTALLSGFQTFLNHEKKVEGHRRVGNKYLSIMKKSKRLESYLKDNVLPKPEIIKRLDSLADEIESVNIEAEVFPTNQQDYNDAKKGIEDGEETYTVDELDT